MWDEMRRKKSKKLRSYCPQLGRLLRRKVLFRELDWDLLRNPRREGQTHRLQGGKKENRCYPCGEPGYFKWECPERSKEEKIVPPYNPWGRIRGVRDPFMWIGPTRSPQYI
jgi:hypothetical protein